MPTLLSILIYGSVFVHTAYAQSCASNYGACFAEGTDREAVPPSIGDDMVGFYEDLVASVEGHSLKRDIGSTVRLESGGIQEGILHRREDEKGSLCCRFLLQVMRNTKDKF